MVESLTILYSLFKNAGTFFIAEVAAEAVVSAVDIDDCWRFETAELTGSDKYGIVNRFIIGIV